MAFAINLLIGSCGSYGPYHGYMIKDYGERSEQVRQFSYQKYRSYLTSVFTTDYRDVTAIAFAPDGKKILTGHSHNNAYLYDIKGQEIAILKHKGWVNSVTFSADGKKILTASDDFKARLWDLAGTELTEFPNPQGNENKYVHVAKFSPDSQLIVTGGNDGMLRIWKPTGQKLFEFKAERVIYDMAISADATKLVTIGVNGSANLWDMQGNQISNFRSKVTANSVAFAPDGTSVLIGYENDTARLWNLRGKPVRSFNHPALDSHTDGIQSVAFSSNGKYILTGSWSWFGIGVILWRSSGEQLRTYKIGSIVNAVAFSPNSKCILIGAKTATLHAIPIEFGGNGNDSAYRKIGNYLSSFFGEPDFGCG